MVDKGLLHWVQPIRGAQAFDGDHAAPGYFVDRNQAGAHSLAVEQDGAGPTLAFGIASLFRAGQVQIFTQDLK
jgi:hypothetical protein